jgi:apolipoprotein N-acyltransferase
VIPTEPPPGTDARGDSSGRGRRLAWSVGPIAALSIAVLVAAPWLDQRLVWSGWAGVAAALLLGHRIRGWWGEGLALAAATGAIAAAFHWTPEALAEALATDHAVGLAIAAPIVLWDAARLVLPFWFIGRVSRDPLAAWVPAASLAVAVEAVMPAVFPWKIGYSQIGWPVVVQSADVLGPEGPTFTLFAHAGVIAWLVHAGVALLRLDRAKAAARIRMPPASGLAFLVCGANLLYGIASLRHWQRLADDAPTIRLAVVQANPGADDGIEILRRLTRRIEASSRPPDLACWPECSGGCYAETLDSLADPDRVLELSRAPNAGLRPLDDPGSPLLFGGKIYRGHPERPRAIHQSAILIDADERVVGRYHKRHLMPFGEYVPGDAWFPDIRRCFAMQEEFTEGREPTVLSWDGRARLGVMLCYEDMIPSAARSLVAGSANLLVSLINGAAFPQPLTLAQHRLLSQLRAVESRRCLVRCAATGETCVISPLGEITAALPPRATGALVVDVPLLESATVATRTGGAFPLACAAVSAGYAIRRRQEGRRAA